MEVPISKTTIESFKKELSYFREHYLDPERTIVFKNVRGNVNTFLDDAKEHLKNAGLINDADALLITNGNKTDLLVFPRDDKDKPDPLKLHRTAHEELGSISLEQYLNSVSEGLNEECQVIPDTAEKAGQLAELIDNLTDDWDEKEVKTKLKAVFCDDGLLDKISELKKKGSGAAVLSMTIQRALANVARHNMDKFKKSARILKHIWPLEENKNIFTSIMELNEDGLTEAKSHKGVSKTTTKRRTMDFAAFKKNKLNIEKGESELQKASMSGEKTGEKGYATLDEQELNEYGKFGNEPKQSTDKKIYVIEYTRPRATKPRYIKGTVNNLRDYFSYTLEIGHSHRRSINMYPTTIKGLMKSLEQSYDEKEGALYNRTMIRLVPEVPAGTDPRDISDQTEKEEVKAEPAQSSNPTPNVTESRRIKLFEEFETECDTYCHSDLNRKLKNKGKAVSESEETEVDGELEDKSDGTKYAQNKPADVTNRALLNVGKKYTDNKSMFGKLAKAVDEMEWQEIPKDGKQLTLAALPGLGIKGVIKEFKLPGVDKIAISHNLAPYGFYGIQANYKKGDVKRIRLYVLDFGDHITPVFVDEYKS